MRVRGFTLIEMLVVLAMLGVLAAAARPLLELATQRSRETELRAHLRQIRHALDAYRQAVEDGAIPRAADASGYPPELLALTRGVTDARSAEGRKLYFLRRLPRDPFADPAVAPEDSWGLRAYDSPPEDPRAGRDVYDVFSKTERKALDGTRLKDW